MNRPATLIFAIAFSLAAASAMAQTVLKAKPKAKAKPVLVSKEQKRPKAAVVAQAQTVLKAKPKAKAKPAVVSKEQTQPEAAVVALAPLAANNTNANPSPPVTAVYPITDYLRGQSLEAINRRLALAAYRQAAEQGHGPSQKRLWQLLKDTPGSESVATVYQKDAWKQGVPGVPKPLSPVRFY